MASADTRNQSGAPAFCRRLRTASRAGGLASTAGFTLLEALLSSALVGIAGMGVLMMFATGQTLVQSSGTDRIAAQLAQQRIEQVRAAGYGSNAAIDPRVEATWTPVPDNPGYERRTEITNVCWNNFASACSPETGGARRVVVFVRALNGSEAETDPQTTPAVIQTVLVRR